MNTTILYSASKPLSADHQPVRVAGFIVAFVRAELLIGIELARAPQVAKPRHGETVLNAVAVPDNLLDTRQA